MLKFLRLSLLSLFFVPSIILASTSSPTLSELQAQIQALVQQIQILQAKKAGQSLSIPVTTSFNSDLTIGSSGVQVATLQQFLVSKGYLIMPVGVAYGYYGPVTAGAVSKFQSANGITTTGSLGPLTRAKLNGLNLPTAKPPTNTTTPTVGVAPDGSGGGQSKSISISNPNTVTYPAPKVTFVSSSYNISVGQSATLSWTSGDTNSCTAGNAWSGSKNTGGSETVFPTQTSIYNLTCNGPGGIAVQSVTISVTSAPISLDTTAPTMSNGAPSGILTSGTTQTTLSLNTDESAVCRFSPSDVVYGLMPTQFTTTGGSSHSYLLTGMSDGSSYNYYVRCSDNSSNTDLSSLHISFSVASAPVIPPVNPPVTPPVTPPSTPDTTPPPNPGSPAIGNTTTSATDVTYSLSWTASIDQPSNTEVPNYSYGAGYNDGTNAVNGTTTTHSLSLTLPLAPSATTGFICIRAVDSAGNRSSNQSCASLTIPSSVVTPPADTTPPTVSVTSPSTGTVSGTVMISAIASDNIGVSGVQFKLDGSNLQAEDTSSPYSISWDTTGVSNGTHTLTAIARDAAGNTTTSSSVSVTVSNNVVVQPPVQPPPAQLGISGTIRNQTNSQAVPNGGSVELYDSSGSNLLSTASVDSSGNYSFNNLSSGNYHVMLQPNLSWSMGDSEPDSQSYSPSVAPSVSVANGIVTHDITVRPAYYFDDFSAYADTSALENTSSGFGAKAPFINSTAFHQGPGCLISLDPTGGLNGGHALRYDFPNRSNDNNTNFNCNAELVTRSANRAPSPTGAVWVRLVDRTTPGFHIGNLADNTSMAYKYIRVFIQGSSDPNIDFGWNPTGNAQTTGFNNTTMTAFLEDGIHLPVHYDQTVQLGSASSFFNGSFKTHVLGVTNIGSPNAVLKIYIDGQLKTTIGPFTFDKAPNDFNSLSLGSVINNGPDQAESRWFANVGIYFSRPALR